MIDLGLARVSRLLRHTPQSWKAIHVAGTNGKGSICAYLSALLHATGTSTGRFTSPHLIDRWDCITVNERPVSETVFQEVEKLVKQRDREDGIGATEYELLTATAFEIFHRERIDYGVIEVGMGGRLDATNAMKQKTVTVICKIGLDHQGFLGNTLEEIAVQKAGIMRAGVPCVVDDSNPTSVLQVIRDHAKEVGASITNSSTSEISQKLAQNGFQPHQIQNLSCAHLAFRLARPDETLGPDRALSIARELQWPGRLQTIDLANVTHPTTTGQKRLALLDGAHNPQSAEVLAQFVAQKLRRQQQPVTWVLAASDGKDLDGVFGLLVQPGDTVAAVAFGPVDGMPWVKPANTATIADLARRRGAREANQFPSSAELRVALNWAVGQAGDGPVVIAGSLYLVSDILRLIRDESGSS